MKIIHTSARHFGQIYVPQVNWLVMIATLGLVLGFESSSKLAAAYGAAVTSTMLISTILFYVVARERWRWNRLAAGAPVAVFLIVDLCFFSANVTKMLHGAWFPLAVGAALLLVMMTWNRGRELLAAQLLSLSIPFGELLDKLSTEHIRRVKGQAVFMTGHPGRVPVALSHNIRHNKVVHSRVTFLHFSPVEVPRVPNKDKLRIDKLGGGFYRFTVYYGYMESPSVPVAFSLARGQGQNLELEETSFFLGRERLVWGEGSGLSRWRAHLFAFLSRNAYDASSFFDIPQERVAEIGVRLKI